MTSSMRDDVKADAMEVEEEEERETSSAGGGVGAGGKAYMTQSLFSALPINKLVKRALADVMKYTNLTQVSRKEKEEGVGRGI